MKSICNYKCWTVGRLKRHIDNPQCAFRLREKRLIESKQWHSGAVCDASWRILSEREGKACI